MENVMIKIILISFLLIVQFLLLITIKRLMSKHKNEIKFIEIILGTVFALSLGKNQVHTEVSKSPNTLLGLLMIIQCLLTILVLTLFVTILIPLMK